MKATRAIALAAAFVVVGALEGCSAFRSADDADANAEAGAGDGGDGASSSDGASGEADANGSTDATPTADANGPGAIGNGNGKDGEYSDGKDQVNDFARLADPVVAGDRKVTLQNAPSSFVVGGDVVMLWQSEDPSSVTPGLEPGRYELARVQSFVNGMVTLDAPIANAYPPTSTQAVRVPQYTKVHVSTDRSLFAKYWFEQGGGMLAFLSTGAVELEGTVSASGRGFPAGGQADCTSDSVPGGRGAAMSGGNPGDCIWGGGGGGGNASRGGAGGNASSAAGGGGGAAITGAGPQGRLMMGGGGGAGAGYDTVSAFAPPSGGGVVFIRAPRVSGKVQANGADGRAGAVSVTGAGGGGTGGGAGGTIVVDAPDVSGLVANASGGAGGMQADGTIGGSCGGGGGGGAGVVIAPGAAITTNGGLGSGGGTGGGGQ